MGRPRRRDRRHVRRTDEHLWEFAHHHDNEPLRWHDNDTDIRPAGPDIVHVPSPDLAAWNAADPPHPLTTTVSSSSPVAATAHVGARWAFRWDLSSPLTCAVNFVGPCPPRARTPLPETLAAPQRVVRLP